jgi:acyl carrier protein
MNERALDAAVDLELHQAVRAAALQRGIELPSGDEEDLTLALDSFARVELLEAVEEAFGVRVRPRDATAESFGSVAKIAAFVRAARARARGPAGGA